MDMRLVPLLWLGCSARADPAASPAPTSAINPPAWVPGPTVNALRKNFRSRLPPLAIPRDDTPEEAPDGMYQTLSFPGPLGSMRAYLSPDPHDGKRHPAILDLHSGFGGIGNELWLYYDYARPFRDAGIVHFYPTRRGDNDNAGEFETFWGEVDDAAASLRYLRTLPYIDPNRIYVIGHSTGGTLALLLASEVSGVRAVFSFEGAPIISTWARQFVLQGGLPDLPADSPEYLLRSPITFAGSLRQPTFYFYSSAGFFADDGEAYATAAAASGTPFLQTVEVQYADHETLFYRLSDWLTDEIQHDVDVTRPFPRLNQTDVQVAFGSYLLRPDDGRDHRSTYVHPR